MEARREESKVRTDQVFGSTDFLLRLSKTWSVRTLRGVVRSDVFGHYYRHAVPQGFLCKNFRMRRLCSETKAFAQEVL
jgi:hypothetical protein